MFVAQRLLASAISFESCLAWGLVGFNDTAVPFEQVTGNLIYRIEGFEKQLINGSGRSRSSGLGVMIMRIGAMKAIRDMGCTGVCLLLVTACGGGGGGGGSDPGDAQLITLSPTNAETVAALAYHSAKGLVPNADLGTPVTILSATGGPTGPKTSVPALVIPDMADRRRVAGLIQTADCPVSGSFTIDFDEAAGTGSLSYDQCDTGDGVVDGVISFAGLAETGTAPNTTVVMSVSFNNLTVTDTSETLGINGAYSATVVSTADTVEARVSGNLLSVTEGVDNHSLSHFTFTETSYLNQTGPTTATADYTLSSTLIGGAVTVNTPVPFVTYVGATYPHTGSLLINGAQSTMKLTAQGDENYLPLDQQVLLEIDSDGDGVYETRQTMAWTDLDA
jgi:hypothetical protein